MTTTPSAAPGSHPATRTEKDTMGPMEVPASALYGASTQRAVLNFPVSGRPVPDLIIKAYATLKAACATVNHRLGRLDENRTRSIHEACREIADGLPAFGGLAPHFPIDIYQTGSGTSTNMNVNEVIANLVCVRHHKPIGLSKDPAWIAAGGVHPNDHVNMGQSSNDTFPTAMHIAAAQLIQSELLPAVQSIAQDLEAKAAAWDKVVKIGRTHLQDATPIRLGQEFSGYASQMRHAEERLHRCLHTLSELAIGGTAVGTGINAHEDFGRLVAAQLMQQTGIHFREAVNHFEAQAAKDAIVETSGHLKTIAVSLSKLANDIRWLGSGPRCGIGELILPAVQPGSSIMPGKVNPVICEALIMVCCSVIGNDAAITLGGLGGIGSLLDLNVAMPMMAAHLLDSIHLLARGITVFQDNLLSGPVPAGASRGTGFQPVSPRSSSSGTGFQPVSPQSLSSGTGFQPVSSSRPPSPPASGPGEVPPSSAAVRGSGGSGAAGGPPATSYGLQPDLDRCKGLIEGSLAMCTSLVPVIGYDKSAALAKEAFRLGLTVRELAHKTVVGQKALDGRTITQSDIDSALDPWSMTLPGGEGSAGG